MRTKILSALFCGIAALCLTACDEEPVVESAPGADAVAVEGAPACCSVAVDGPAAAAADVAAEASECETMSECAEISECETKSECEDMTQCDEVTECTPEELEQCKEKGKSPCEKSPE